VTALIAVETVLLVLLGLLVVGLLRSHAEILRRLGTDEDEGAQEIDDSPPGRGAQQRRLNLAHLPSPRAEITPAFDIAGTTPSGSAVKIAMEGPTSTLVAFLSSGCLTCQVFWEELASTPAPTIPGEPRLVVVTKDAAFESPSRLRDLSPPGIPVVMSSAAWEAYGIATSPSFVYVDESGRVRSEGSASSWSQVRSLLRDAVADEEMAAAQDGP
jgi:hypothetical protein